VAVGQTRGNPLKLETATNTKMRTNSKEAVVIRKVKIPTLRSRRTRQSALSALPTTWWTIKSSNLTKTSFKTKTRCLISGVVVTNAKARAKQPKTWAQQATTLTMLMITNTTRPRKSSSSRKASKTRGTKQKLSTTIRTFWPSSRI